MKKGIIILVIAIIFTSCASNSSFHSFYKENKNVSEFSMNSPALLAKIFISKDDYKEFKPLFKHVKHFKIMVFENADKSVDRKFNRFIKQKDFGTLFRVVDNGANVQFYLSNKKDKKEIILRVKDNESYILLGLKTNMSEEDLDKIFQKMSFETNEKFVSTE